MKTIKTFFGNQPVLEIQTNTSQGPNFGKEYGLNRDRNPDRDWGEYRISSMGNSQDTELTPELLQILVEDLAHYYGENSKRFSEKLKEFGIKFIIE